MKKIIIGLMLQALVPSTMLAQTGTVKAKCIGTYKNGNPCRNYAIEGSQYCRMHNPEAFHCGVLTKAGKPCMRVVKTEGAHCSQHSK